MIREKQISEAIKLISPKDRTACAKFLTMALDDVDAQKQQRQHEQDVASKTALKALETYRAALCRARAAKQNLPPGMKQDLAIIEKISRDVDFDALIKDCDLLGRRSPRKPGDFCKITAVAWAKNALDSENVESPLTRDGKWHKLSAILYGDVKSDLFHHCSQWHRSLITGQK